MPEIEEIEDRIKGIREWLKKEAPECFVVQKHTEEGTRSAFILAPRIHDGSP